MAELTEQQQTTLDYVINLLEPLKRGIRVSHDIVFYRDEEGSEEFPDNDTCSDEKCVEQAKKTIVKIMKKEVKGKRIV